MARRARRGRARLRVDAAREPRDLSRQPLDLSVLDGERHVHLPVSMAMLPWCLQGGVCSTQG